MTASAEVDSEVLDAIQRRVLWLATRMVDLANRGRDAGDGVKIGGHQASSASLVTAMTALWFAHLDGADRVSVKPHASPVFHAIQYLLGNLDRSYLQRFRTRGGLQSYPSRTKDPDGVDFSTGSVGLGAAAPLFAALARRYVDAHFGPRPAARFVSILGDAELDEGNVWEAVCEPATAGLGNVLWLVDFNRQSLDRVVPGVRITQWREQFRAAGWHVVEVKYGRRLEVLFQQPGGGSLRAWLDAMPNEQYQSLFALPDQDFRKRFLDGAPAQVRQFTDALDDTVLRDSVTGLGGHDLDSLRAAFAECDAVSDRPSVVFAYTVKGWRLPIAGNPRNHSALLTADQIDTLREQVGLTGQTEWDAFAPDTAEGRWIEHRRRIMARTPVARGLPVTVPESTGQRGDKPSSTQEAFGRMLVDLGRGGEVGRYLVSTAPDVATSTNLAGFINKVGVFAPDERRRWSEDLALRWVEGPQGQHIELGIAEMNLFLLLGQLGLSWAHSQQPLVPIGTVYDPFVLRGLDAFIYGTYSGSRFIVAGTPSGVTLAPEGGAHQSTLTPSVGLELPGVTLIEPAYVGALDWLLCDAVGRVAAPDAAATGGPSDCGAYYFRLTTRRLDQTPFTAARARIGDAALRQQVIAGAYRLHDALVAHPELRRRDTPIVHLAASGAVLPEVLAAAEELADEGVAAHVVDITSLDRLYAAWQHGLRRDVRSARFPALPGALRAAFGMASAAPVVTVHDGSSHAMAWLGSALGRHCVPLGVDEFGQSGSIQDLYELHDLVPGVIVNAALAALALASTT